MSKRTLPSEDAENIPRVISKRTWTQQSELSRSSKRARVQNADQNWSSPPGLSPNPYLRLPPPLTSTSIVSGHQHNKPANPVQGDDCIAESPLPQVGHTVHDTSEPLPSAAFHGDGIFTINADLPRRGTSSTDEPLDRGNTQSPPSKVVRIFDTGSGSTHCYKNAEQPVASTWVCQPVPSRNLSSLNLTGPPQTSSQTAPPQSTSTASKGVAPTAAYHVGCRKNTVEFPRLKSSPAPEPPMNSTEYPTPPSTGPKAPATPLFGALSVSMQHTSLRSSARRTLNFRTSNRVSMANLLDSNLVHGPRCPVISSPSGVFGQPSHRHSRLRLKLVECTKSHFSDGDLPVRKIRAVSEHGSSSAINGRSRPASKRSGSKSAPSYIHKVTSSKSRQRAATCRYCHRQCRYRPELNSSMQCHPWCFDAQLYEPKENGEPAIHHVHGLHNALSSVTRSDSPVAVAMAVAIDNDEGEGDEGIKENAPNIQLVRSKRTSGGKVKPVRPPYPSGASATYSRGYSERGNHELPNSDSTISVPDKTEFFGRYIDSDSNAISMRFAAHNSAPSSDFVALPIPESVNTLGLHHGNAYADSSQSVGLEQYIRHASCQLLAEAELANRISHFLANSPVHLPQTSLVAMARGNAIHSMSSNPMMGGDSADI